MGELIPEDKFQNTWQKRIKTFLKEDDAQAMVEYVLLAFIFILAFYGVMELMKNAWQSRWKNVTNRRAGGFPSWGIGP